MKQTSELLRQVLTEENYGKLEALGNTAVMEFIAEAVDLARPESVFVCTDMPEDAAYIRQLAVENGEEFTLDVPGHTCHFDGYNDQGRDKFSTRYLVEAGSPIAGVLNSIDRDQGLAEVKGLLSGSMEGRRMLVCFFCLGPIDSVFSLSCVQITDSAYVAHSEFLLYRPGYEQIKKAGPSGEFFSFIHSQGRLEDSVSAEPANRRVYIDLAGERVYSVNTQYGGNTIGLKKLALRLAIQKASAEGWLAEHMFVMAAHGPGGRATYFAGAFPSACGKTSTSMIPGQTIIGDDIAYLKKKDGVARCVNVEKGIFGIVQDVNPEDDPIIYEALTSPIEVIFSNILVDSNLRPHWLGMGEELPAEGTNHSGKWHHGKEDSNGNVITASHKNARYCLSITDLKNRDPMLDDLEGVPLGGLIYGGRDSDTWIPVEKAYNWAEGIILKGAALESETTAATLGKEGVRSFNLMSNLDFLSIPMGVYIENNLKFADGLKNPPAIFSVNYFLRDDEGKYITGMSDKKVWILWAELAVHGQARMLETPTGLIPVYEDLCSLFKEHLDKDYTRDDYVRQFTIRVPENLSKLERVEEIYRGMTGIPQVVFDTFETVRGRLQSAASERGDYISPMDLERQ